MDKHTSGHAMHRPHISVKKDHPQQQGKRLILKQRKETTIPQTPKIALPKVKKMYVLDTNVLMHDWSALRRFQEHDIFIPLMVLHELDNNKKGMEESAYNSRETTRFLGELKQAMRKNVPHWKLSDGLALKYSEGGTINMGRIFIQTEAEAKIAARMETVDGSMKADTLILNAVQMLMDTRSKEYSSIILVTKDLNMSFVALSRGILEEDFKSDNVPTTTDKELYSGMIELPARTFRNMKQIRPPSRNGDTTICEIDIPPGVILYPNQLITGDSSNTNNWIVSEVGEKTAKIRHCVNYISDNKMYGINARNLEQNFLLNLLMEPEIDLVSILGQAGTGKTLMTMIAAFELVRMGIYNGIIYTRATVPVGDEDIGFLPGDEKDKMGAWAGALADNAEVIVEAMSERSMKSDNHETNKIAQRLIDKHTPRKTKSPSTLDDISEASSPMRDEAIVNLLRGIKVKSTGFMRGRSYQKKILIIDEAQNNTPKQMKTLISRAGPGTKIIILGNLAQIDTPYIAAQSSGLAYSTACFMSWGHYGHITLTRVERSRLADYAVEVMK